MTAAAAPAIPRAPFRPNWTTRLIAVAIIAYAIYACSLLDITFARFIAGFGEAERFLSRMFPPNFERWEILVNGVVESLQISVIATIFGIALSLPLGLMASRNMMPIWVSGPTRMLIALCRSFHPVIVAILFVKAVGFGALAGVLALIVGSIGFIAKLFAEAIEEISPKQVEAIRATGAGFANTITFGVLPQVLPRFLGFSLYQLDSNLRNSTMVGIVGAGGIGGTLFAAFKRFDYDFMLAILLVVIALIMIGEIISQKLRRTFV